MTTETTPSVLARCGEIEREMTALTEELRQKTAELKAFYGTYNKKLAELDTEWHDLFHSISKDSEVLKEYYDLTDDIGREIS